MTLGLPLVLVALSLESLPVVFASPLVAVGLSVWEADWEAWSVSLGEAVVEASSFLAELDWSSLSALNQ